MYTTKKEHQQWEFELVLVKMGSIVATFAILAVLTRPKIALTLEHDASDVVTGLESFEDIHVDNSLDWNTEANDECSNLVVSGPVKRLQIAKCDIF